MRSTIRADTNRLYLILIVGLSLLYAIVFRVVARASRKLRTHGKEMSAHLERTKYESEHDPLTHLPNRTLFRSHVGGCDRGGSPHRRAAPPCC